MKILYFILPLLLLASCFSGERPSEKVIKERLLSGEFEMYSHLARNHCDSLDKDSLNNYFLGDSLYTGECYVHYPNTKRRYETRQIFMGKLHGNKIIFSPKGDTLSQSIYNLGKLVSRKTGEKELQHCDSLIKRTSSDGETIMYYLDVPYTGKCISYYPAPDTNKIYIEIPYRAGKIHGNLIIYNRQGEELMREVHEDGKKI